jgi:integrase
VSRARPTVFGLPPVDYDGLPGAVKSPETLATSHFQGHHDLLSAGGPNRENSIKPGCLTDSRSEPEKLAPHDLRRTCTRLCHLAGGELDQIQFLLGHVSIQTTERYLGCKQKFRDAVNDRMGIEPETNHWPK